MNVPRARARARAHEQIYIDDLENLDKWGLNIQWSERFFCQNKSTFSLFLVRLNAGKD
jgi:hypothetical protein